MAKHASAHICVMQACSPSKRTTTMRWRRNVLIELMEIGANKYASTVAIPLMVRLNLCECEIRRSLSFYLSVRTRQSRNGVCDLLWGDENRCISALMDSITIIPESSLLLYLLNVYFQNRANNIFPRVWCPSLFECSKLSHRVGWRSTADGPRDHKRHERRSNEHTQNMRECKKRRAERVKSHLRI